MLIRVLLVSLLAWAIVFSALADEPKKAAGDEPAEFREAEIIGIVQINDWLRFNYGRPYAISINKYLTDSQLNRSKLAKTLKEQKQLEQVVFGWHGEKPPKRLNLTIGEKVPVPVAQAVIAVYATDAEIPVYIALLTQDNDLGQTCRIYVGGLVDCGKEPVTAKQLKELLKPGITQKQFAELLPKAED